MLWLSNEHFRLFIHTIAAEKIDAKRTQARPNPVPAGQAASLGAMDKIDP